MAERLEFREKLAGILTLCESQNNITDKATVEAYFAEDNLSAEQMELVFDYLLSKKVMQAAKNEEVRYYLGIIGLAIVAIAVNTRGMFTSFGRANGGES